MTYSPCAPGQQNQCTLRPFGGGTSRCATRCRRLTRMPNDTEQRHPSQPSSTSAEARAWQRQGRRKCTSHLEMKVEISAILVAQRASFAFRSRRLALFEAERIKTFTDSTYTKTIQDNHALISRRAIREFRPHFRDFQRSHRCLLPRQRQRDHPVSCTQTHLTHTNTSPLLPLGGSDHL